MKELTGKEWFNRKKEREEYLREYDENDCNFKTLKTLKRNKTILSLGCGGGREVKFLCSIGSKVTAIDFADKMIEQSKKIEPNAEYICQDVIDYARKEKRKRKYDYIIGMYNFLCGIEHKERQEFINNLLTILKEDGELILSFRYINMGLKEYLRLFITPFFCLFMGREYHFGDVVYNLSIGRYNFAHYFTKPEIKKLFRGSFFKIEGTVIRAKNRENKENR